MPRQICLKRNVILLSFLLLASHPVINPDDILLIKGIPKLVIVRDAAV